MKKVLECLKLKENQYLYGFNKIDVMNINENYSYDEIMDYINLLNTYSIDEQIKKLTNEFKSEVDENKKVLIAKEIQDLKVRV